MIKKLMLSPLAAVFVITLLLLTSLPVIEAQRQTTSRANGARPKLVVAIVIDQFRYDYLERFGDLFGAGGFRRLVSEGALFTNAHYDYVPTYTAPGHASIFTGSVPAQNGVVGNNWFDREMGIVRVMVSDTEARAVSDSGVAADLGSVSPRALIGTTISDQIRLSNNFQSKVVAVSFKDRSAILPGGHKPNGAFWFNNKIGAFVSSDYYFKELPAWVRQFNNTERPGKYFGAKWERALKDEAYERAQADTLAVQTSRLGSKFPYVVTGGEEKPGSNFYAAFELTPFASEYLAGFAKAAIEAESLGADQFTDLLSISFSTPDLVGHAYGPDAQEVLDTYIRLDRVIADLLNYIDRRVGLRSTLLFLTADHGVAPVPEYMRSLGFDAHRLSPKHLIEAAETALAARFGGEKWVLAFVNDQLYLNHNLIRERKVDPAEAERLAGEAVMGVAGVTNYFTRSQIVEGRMPSSDLARRVMNGFNRARSGDVSIIVKPFSFFSESLSATTHGSPYSYDTHIPVLFFGAGIRAGRYNRECAPSDIAPTLAALLGVEPPSNKTGRVLIEAIASEGQAATAQ